MNQIAKAAELALLTCPKTTWMWEPFADSSGRRMDSETMKSDILEEASRARAGVYTMLVQWALTGTWPKFRNASVYFTRKILTRSAAKGRFALEKDFPDAPPPWESKYVATFLDRTALGWYSLHLNDWAAEVASDAFDSQESIHRTMSVGD
jgi:hypothetical protein